MKRLAILLFFAFALSGTSFAGTNGCCAVGTGTPGFWMNHPGAWPVDIIEVGGVEYSKEEAIALMKLPVKGDKSLTMFAAFVAALLNVEIGNCPPPCYSLEEVDTWLTNFPVQSGIEARSEAWQYSHGEALYLCLDAYNNGLFPGIPSRDALE